MGAADHRLARVQEGRAADDHLRRGGGHGPGGRRERVLQPAAGPNTPNPGGPVPGPGGGRIGALLISPFVKAGTVNPSPYNHYAFLRSVEDFFRLPHLGYAGRPDLRAFGSDVFGVRR